MEDARDRRKCFAWQSAFAEPLDSELAGDDRELVQARPPRNERRLPFARASRPSPRHDANPQETERSEYLDGHVNARSLLLLDEFVARCPAGGPGPACLALLWNLFYCTQRRSMRRALLIGIDDYPGESLLGCVRDAVTINNVLARNHDDSPNFDCRLRTGAVRRAELKQELSKLFSTPADTVLFYFAGHGVLSETGSGHLLTADSLSPDDGLPITELFAFLGKGQFKDAVVILDCCFSGAAGRWSLLGNVSVLPEGVSVLTACRHDEHAVERVGRGLFTSLVCDALLGGAADLRGYVTTASVYSYVDQILTAWDQRPQFRANVSQLSPLRRCLPRVLDADLRELPRLFPAPEYEYPLAPSYEPESGFEPRNEEHERVFRLFQRLRDVSLLKPCGATHLYYAAMESQRCVLTALGRYYWALAKAGRI